MQRDTKQGSSARWSGKLILAMFVVTSSLPIVGKLYDAYRSHRATRNDDPVKAGASPRSSERSQVAQDKQETHHKTSRQDEPAKTSMAARPSGTWLVHVKAPEKPDGNLEASRNPPASSIQKPEAPIREVVGQ
jgi:hypothetical protein